MRIQSVVGRRYFGALASRRFVRLWFWRWVITFGEAL